MGIGSTTCRAKKTNESAEWTLFVIYWKWNTAYLKNYTTIICDVCTCKWKLRKRIYKNKMKEGNDK